MSVVVGGTPTYTTTTEYLPTGTTVLAGAPVTSVSSVPAYTTVPGATTTTYEYVQQPLATTTYVQQPLTTTLAVAPTTVVAAPAVGLATSQIGGEVIKGQSRIEYIPFEQRVTDYEIREWVETIPKQRTITEYQERRYTETVPREVTKVDYYAIEYLKQYIPQVIPETTVETIPVERVVQRTEYIPVERYNIIITQENRSLPRNPSGRGVPEQDQPGHLPRQRR
jgi:hypothetical protein